MVFDIIPAKPKSFIIKDERKIYIVRTDIVNYISCSRICVATKNKVNDQQKCRFSYRVITCAGAQHHAETRIETDLLLLESVTTNLI